MFEIKVTLTADSALLNAIKMLGGGVSAELTSTQQLPGQIEMVLPVEQTAVTPEDAPQHIYTIEDVRAKILEVNKSGKRDAVKAILKELGCSKVTEIKEEDYATVIEKVEAL